MRKPQKGKPRSATGTRPIPKRLPPRRSDAIVETPLLLFFPWDSQNGILGFFNEDRWVTHRLIKTKTERMQSVFADEQLIERG